MQVTMKALVHNVQMHSNLAVTGWGRSQVAGCAAAKLATTVGN